MNQLFIRYHRLTNYATSHHLAHFLHWTVVTITNHNLTGFLIDDKSLCNIPYSYTTNMIGIKQAYLNMYNGRELLAFNNLITYPQWAIDLTVIVREESYERKVTPNFLIIQCQSTIRGVLKRSFLARLDAITSPIHLKVIYHDVEGRSVSVIADVDEVERINESSRRIFWRLPWPLNQE